MYVHAEITEVSDGIYEGTIEGGRFLQEEIDVANGKKYELIVQIENIKNSAVVLRNISFEIEVIVYKTFVTPT